MNKLIKSKCGCSSKRYCAHQKIHSNFGRVHRELKHCSLFPPKSKSTLKLLKNLMMTLCLLPRKIQKFACEKCHFLILSYTFHGLGCKPMGNRFPIILTTNIKKEDPYSIIAHEIAHAWRRHTGICDLKDEHVEELGATRLAYKWGLRGWGANVDELIKNHAFNEFAQENGLSKKERLELAKRVEKAMGDL